MVYHVLPRWLIVVVISALVAILISGIYFYRIQEKQQLQQVVSELKTLTELKAKEISDWRRDQLKDAAILQKDFFLNRSIRNFVSNPGAENREDLFIRLLSLSQQHDFADIVLLDTSGKTLFDLIGHKEVCQEVLNGLVHALETRKPVFIDFHQGKDFDKPHLGALAPLWNEDGRVLGALAFICDASKALYPLIQAWPLSFSTGETILVRRDGDNVLYLNNLKYKKDAALTLRLPINQENLPEAGSVSGQLGFKIGKDYRGVSVAAFSMSIADASWIIVTEVDAKEAFASWRWNSIMILGWMGTLLCVVLISGFAFFHKEKSRHLKLMLALDLEKQQMESQRRQLFDIIEKSLNEVYVFDVKTLKFKYVNAGALKNLGFTSDQIREMTPVDLKPEYEEDAFRAAIQPLLDNKQDSLIFETVHRRADGTDYPVEVHLQLIDAEADRVFLAVVFDISERKKIQLEQENLQSQLVQAQKMESIGRLAGGIAHDFNNLLSIILGYGDLIRDSLPKHHHSRELHQEIRDAALRAKELTRQLLAFSRRQVLEFRSVDINQVLADFQRLLIRLLGEEIELQIKRSSAPLYVLADSSQLEQVFMNLAVNARDAMDNRGRLTIETSKVILDESYTDNKNRELTPGAYAQISIRDTGCGMDQDTQSHIFEPFFTTKDKNIGTGLGLATSYGIIKQHNGGVWVYSEPGMGTTFNVYLPLTRKPAAVDAPASPVMAPVIGSATVLVVEDDASLRKLIVNMLHIKGYQVIESESTDDAIEKAGQTASPIHLVLSDVIMPNMRGPEVFKKISELHPESRVLYMSGYAGDSITRNGLVQEGIPLIQKPFSVETLLEKMTAVLSSPAGNVSEP